jgi:hypothetical protein
MKQTAVETLLYFGLGAAIGALIVKLIELVIKTFKQQEQ